MTSTIPFSRRGIAAIVAAVATACVGLALLDPTTSTSSNFDQTADGTSIPVRQVHGLLPEVQAGFDDARLEEIRCLRRKQPGSYCRASL